ncbi:hypothetical protein BJX76DRAFT_344480 [Aspergillus varians]
MAQAADLLSTPLLSGQSPSGTLPDLSTTPISLSDGLVGNTPETPSPCARKSARLVEKQGRQRATRNEIIDAFIRMNNSPKFAEMLPNLTGSASYRRPEPEQVEAIELHTDDGEPRAEDPKNQQNCEQPATSTEAPNLEDTPSENPNEEPSAPLLPTFIPSRHTIQEILHDMRAVMTKPHNNSSNSSNSNSSNSNNNNSNNNNNKGYAYVIFPPLDQGPFKIGSTIHPNLRKDDHWRKCHLKGWEFRMRSAAPIRKPLRLERIVQTELQNINCDPKCICGQKHTEYFWGSKDVGLKSLDSWSQWLRHHEPYDCDEVLKDFWVDRLDLFQARIHEYFRCGSPECAEQDEDTPACLACLRAGWRQWAEPTQHDQLDYACRVNIPLSSARWSMQWFSKFGIVDPLYLMAFVNLVGQVLSMWRWISDPRVFLCAIPLRLLGCWVEPRVRLPGPAASWILSVVDTTLFLVCVYTRFQQGLGALEDAKGSPKKTRKAKRVSIGGVTRQIHEREPAMEIDASTPPTSRSSATRATGTRRTTS